MQPTSDIDNGGCEVPGVEAPRAQPGVPDVVTTIESHYLAQDELDSGRACRAAEAAGPSRRTRGSSYDTREPQTDAGGIDPASTASTHIIDPGAGRPFRRCRKTRPISRPVRGTWR